MTCPYSLSLSCSGHSVVSVTLQICALVAARPPSCLDLDKSLTEVATANGTISHDASSIALPCLRDNYQTILGAQLTSRDQRQVGHRRSYLLWFSREREVRSIRAQEHIV
eukprot:scaffold48_cov122-Skeletonema_menzelii.AAC.10